MLGICKNFDQRFLQIEMIEKWEMPVYIMVEFDRFDLDLHKITAFPFNFIDLSTVRRR